MTNTWEERFEKIWANWTDSGESTFRESIRFFIREERKRWVEELLPLIERAEAAFTELDKLTK